MPLTKQDLSARDTSTKWARVHCLVHLGYDGWDYLEFENAIQNYISYIAWRTNDILIIISDGESFDNEQLTQRIHMQIIEWISLYLWLHDGGIWDMIEVYSPEGRYSQILTRNGLDESFYHWCEKNIGMTELLEISQNWRQLKEDFFGWKYRGNQELHNIKAERLKEVERKARIQIDIEKLSYKALEDLWFLNTDHTHSQRVIRNPARFYRIYQHALRVLGRERIREIYIADAEHPHKVAIQPVSHFQTIDGGILRTPIVPPFSDFSAQVFNASETDSYGNASTLRDSLTYTLSLSRYQKLINNQPADALRDMNFPVTPETEFIFFWEYRGRCVENVKSVMYHRLRRIAWDRFFTAHNAFTLQRSDDRE
jgi:hypothetical protein